jgi:uncharacterized cupredoxin-like copper-binding protein
MLHRNILTLALLGVASTAAAQGRAVAITASDYAFSAPDSLPAGLTTFEFVNRGPELHHMQIVRLDKGKTMSDFEAAMQSHGPPPAWVTFVGGPNTGIPDGKATVKVSLDLAAGQYVLLCFIPSPDGKPHVAKGMVRPLTVTPARGTVTQASSIQADNVLTLYDYNFDLDKPLTAGTRTIRIKNTAKQFHEVFIAKLPGSTPVTAMMEWLSGGMKGPPPVVPVGGIVGINAGIDNYLTLDLEPGEYGLYCFLPAPDGREHVQHGMFKKITVAK